MEKEKVATDKPAGVVEEKKKKPPTNPKEKLDQIVLEQYIMMRDVSN
jgi:hypothetical protein